MISNERPWDNVLAESAWRGHPAPDGPQSWEGFEPDGYSRSGDLERWAARADDVLDAAVERKMRLITALDRLRFGACRDLERSSTSEVMRGIAHGLAVALWDEARRLSGAPELAMRNGGERDPRFPFSSLNGFLEVAYGGGGSLLGGGPMPMAIAEDRTEDLAKRSRLRALGVEMMPAKTTRSGSHDPRGVDAVNLALTCQLVMREAGLANIHPHAWQWIVAFHVGEVRRVSRKQRLGDLTDRSPQWDTVRMPVTEIASRADVAPLIVRSVLKRARARVFSVLIRRQLISPPVVAPAKTRPSPFADW